MKTVIMLLILATLASGYVVAGKATATVQTIADNKAIQLASIK